jgi:tRNA-(ms[2]io[6]A)-hydroxylase
MATTMFCLRVPTDPSWAQEALKDLNAVLVDHAHCEMKAASNALSLVMRHPGDLNLVRALTGLAREELDHFHRATAFLEQRGLGLGAPPVDDYAAELRKAMARLPNHPHIPSLTDRLLVGALIEARSCERFKLLCSELPADSELRAFYDELFVCEARHYRTYVDLAREAMRAHVRELMRSSPGEELDVEANVEDRLVRLAEAEGRIVQALAERPIRASVHG